MRFLIIAILTISTAWARNEPSVLLYNVSKQTVVSERNSQQVRPLASITKIMTAIVALDTGFGLDRRVDLVKNVGSHLPRQQYSRRELLTALLVKSDNAAAESLAQDYPGGRTEFLIEMNDHARRLGMKNTFFDDASGLSNKNVSTAEDIVILFKAAMTHDFIRTVSTQTRTEIEVQGKKKPVKLVFGNTNTTLLEEFKNTVVSKTGFTTPAGLCVAMALEEQGQQFVVVVMGATTKKHRTQLVESVIYNNLRP